MSEPVSASDPVTTHVEFCDNRAGGYQGRVKAKAQIPQAERSTIQNGSGATARKREASRLK